MIELQIRTYIRTFICAYINTLLSCFLVWTEHNFDKYKPAKGEVSGVSIINPLIHSALAQLINAKKKSYHFCLLFFKLKTIDYSDLKEVLAKGDDEYVYRPPHYCDFFFGSLDEKFGRAK